MNRLKMKKKRVIDAQMSPLEFILALSSCDWHTKNVNLYIPASLIDSINKFCLTLEKLTPQSYAAKDQEYQRESPKKMKL